MPSHTPPPETQKELIERLVSLETAIRDKKHEIEDLEKAIRIVRGRLILLQSHGDDEMVSA
jgi:hypothetical protein